MCRVCWVGQSTHCTRHVLTVCASSTTITFILWAKLWTMLLHFSSSTRASGIPKTTSMSHPGPPFSNFVMKAGISLVDLDLGNITETTDLGSSKLGRGSNRCHVEKIFLEYGRDPITSNTSATPTTGPIDRSDSVSARLRLRCREKRAL